jgi:hypothetical protein
MNGKALIALVMAAGIIGFGSTPTFAHGKREHGGAFTEVKEYTFEVVSKEQGEEREEREKETKPHTEKMAFTVYIKDPKLKAVTSGSGTLKVLDGKKQVAESPLTAAGDSFTASADLPHHGRYRLAIDFTPPGEKLLKANVRINVD